MKKTIDIIEVGPRDGFQNIKTFIPTETKIQIIEELLSCGITRLQLTSFVSPKAIPQLQDGALVCQSVIPKYPDVEFYALVPNLKGAKSAYDVGIRNIANVISLSKSHNKANINRTHDESFAELERICQELPDMHVSLDVATTFGCPFEGKYHDHAPLLAFLHRGYDIGIRTFTLCDTVGLADPAQVRTVVELVKNEFPDVDIEIHIHDTRGAGIANTLASIEAGAKGVQTTLGGLGGCPFAPGASGNTATEDLVHMLHEMGYETGINLEKLVAAAKAEFKTIPEGCYSGHLLHLDSEGCCK